MRHSIAALLLAVTTPGVAQVTDPLAVTADPADRAVMAEVAAALATRTPDIVSLDAILAKLPRPTPLRGMIQTFRAQTLWQPTNADPGPATAAIEEAMRLLPDDPRPKFVASTIFTFTGAPRRAADLWLEASRQAPELARVSDRYVMSALVGRLVDIGDHARADGIQGRLGEIGFSSSLAPERSDSALARTRQAVRDQRDSEALSGVTMIGDPNDLLTLYVDKHYAHLWPRISEWAGPDLMGQSRRYLEELRGDWTAANDFETALPYAQRLFRLRDYSAVVQLFLPMFDRVRPGAFQQGAESLGPTVARSLAILGRDGEARSLLEKIVAAMPTDYGANALNIDGAYIMLAAMKADWPQVIARADVFLSRARSEGDSVNSSAILQVQAWRACALWRTERNDDAQQATAEVMIGAAVMPNPVLSLHMCRGDSAAGRALVIARLADENTRDWALRFVQPELPQERTPLDRIIEPAEQAVRTAPDVISAVNKVGRILPGPVDGMMPAGFDPFRARPRNTPLAPDAI